MGLRNLIKLPLDKILLKIKWRETFKPNDKKSVSHD